MKKILVILMLLSSALGLRAQGSISDPFFNHGQARSLNSRIIAPLQPVPGFVNQAIAGMRVSNNRNLVRLAHLKDDYGYAVWDQAKTFTAAGRQTALIPMVRPEDDAITGILVAVKDGATFRYGVMDTGTPFPYASAATGTPGMPGMRDVLALSVLFNRTLFGEVDCDLVQALRALSNNNVRGQTAGSPKSCYVQTTYAGQNCDHIYGTYPDGTMQYLYSDCYDIYNYSFICDTDSADNDDGGSGGGSGGSGGGNGSSGPGEGDNESFCESLDVHKCTTTRVLSTVPSGIHGSCSIVCRLSGCGFQSNVFLQPNGIAGCGFSIGTGSGHGISISLDFTVSIQNLYTNSYINSVSTLDSDCRVSSICGDFFCSYDVVISWIGIPYIWERNSAELSNICYTCRNCQ
ncbi:MAG TPA: hypothetical protein PLZ12_07955 [Saprospiraceae bacterium]|nr:hypothetical protein [Saprospiraceae bacterium]